MNAFMVKCTNILHVYITGNWMHQEAILSTTCRSIQIIYKLIIISSSYVSHFKGTVVTTLVLYFCITHLMWHAGCPLPTISLPWDLPIISTYADNGVAVFFRWHHHRMQFKIIPINMSYTLWTTKSNSKTCK